MILVLVFVFFFMMTQQSQGGGSGRGVMNFGKSRAKMMPPDAKRVTFDDVAGADEEKQELEEIVDFLEAPQKYTHIHRGIIQHALVTPHDTHHRLADHIVVVPVCNGYLPAASALVGCRVVVYD